MHILTVFITKKMSGSEEKQGDRGRVGDATLRHGRRALVSVTELSLSPPQPQPPRVPPSLPISVPLERAGEAGQGRICHISDIHHGFQPSVGG
ncbi:hypothetical protein F7725_026230 [Dissostichus mawsoni]|uniref:Uncharacterized protein n=1 Tax=Dissostichus mawsoni TaxID=36200 RepID=A0A7J5X6K4_DISMA|nr:hypothetical protein F7725_026230 [Dissostichus mawsoni]